jgi:uncharacterized membrane protein
MRQYKKDFSSVSLIRFRPLHVILGLAIVYALFFSTLSIIQHYGLKTQMNDLGNVDQALWASANGDFAMTQSNDLDGKLKSRLGIHANLIFWLLSVIYMVLPYPEILLMLASVACAGTGVGIYAIARKHLGDTWWAVVPAVAFWISPLVQDANLYDFHIITVSTALIVWTFWAFDTDHPRIGWTLLILALLCKEDVALVTIMIGIYFMLSGSLRTGVLVAVVSLVYFLVLFTVIVPFFTDGQGLSKLEGLHNRYAWLGSGFVERFRSIINHPYEVFTYITRPDHLRIVIYLMLCGGIMSLRAWRMLLVAIPPITAGIFAYGHWMTRVTGTYYWIISEAVIVMACILAAEKTMKKSSCRFPWQLVYLGSATLVFSIILSPLPYSISSSWQNYALPPERQTLQEVRKRIPPDASVCVQNNLGAHLSQRTDIAVFPRRCDEADYALFHLRSVGGPDSGLFVRSSSLLYTMLPEHITAIVQGMVLSDDWRLIMQKDGFYLFARNAPDYKNYEQILLQVKEDSNLFKRSYREAAQSRWSWSWYLTGAYTWDQLVRSIKNR